MKTFFIIVLVLQFAIEVLVGLGLALFPEMGSPDAALSEIHQLRNQGFIAIAIGVGTAMLWYQRREPAVVAYAVGFFAIYHSLVTVSGIWNTRIGFEFTPMMLHVVLGALFWILWFKRRAL